MINDVNKIRPAGICSHSTCSSLKCSLWISNFYRRNVLMFPQNKTTCQHRKNYLTIISKTMRCSNANCVDLKPSTLHPPRHPKQHRQNANGWVRCLKEEKVEALLKIRSLLRGEEGLHCLMNDRPNYPQPPWLSVADGSFVQARQMYLCIYLICPHKWRQSSLTSITLAVITAVMFDRNVHADVKSDGRKGGL